MAVKGLILCHEPNIFAIPLSLFYRISTKLCMFVCFTSSGWAKTTATAHMSIKIFMFSLSIVNKLLQSQICFYYAMDYGRIMLSQKDHFNSPLHLKWTPQISVLTPFSAKGNSGNMNNKEMPVTFACWGILSIFLSH